MCSDFMIACNKAWLTREVSRPLRRARCVQQLGTGAVGSQRLSV